MGRTRLRRLWLVGAAFAVVIVGVALSSAESRIEQRRAVARREVCRLNLEQICLAITVFAQEHHGRLPSADGYWADVLLDQNWLSSEVLRCPGSGRQVAFAIVPAMRIVPRDADRVLAFEIAGHADGRHIGYHDGRVEFHSVEEAEEILARVASREDLTRPGAAIDQPPSEE